MHSLDSLPLRAATRTTQIKCSEAECSGVVARVDPRVQIARSAATADSQLDGRCPTCSRPFSIPITVQR